MARTDDYIALGGRQKKDGGEREKREPKPKPSTPEEKEARKRERKAMRAHKQVQKKERLAAAEKPIAGRDGDFKLENECTMCLQKGHLKKNCPLPRQDARMRARDILTDGYRKRKEAAQVLARQRLAAAGKDVQIMDNAAIRKEKKARRRAGREVQAATEG